MEDIAGRTGYSSNDLTYEPRVDYPGAMFSRSKQSKAQVADPHTITQTMADITNLADVDPDARAFSRELQKAQHVIRCIFDAVRKETERASLRKEQFTMKLKDDLRAGSRQLALDTRVSIGMASRAFLRTVATVRCIGPQFYVDYVEDLLDMMVDVLRDVPRLGLSGSPVFQCFDKVYEFLTRLIVVGGDDKKGAQRPQPALPQRLRDRAARVLLSMALSTGSVAEILSLVEAFLTNELRGRRESYTIARQLRVLIKYEPEDKSTDLDADFVGTPITFETTLGKYLAVDPSTKRLVLSAALTDRCVFEARPVGRETVLSSRPDQRKTPPQTVYNLYSPSTKLYVSKNQNGSLVPAPNALERFFIQRRLSAKPLGEPAAAPNAEGIVYSVQAQNGPPSLLMVDDEKVAFRSEIPAPGRRRGGESAFTVKVKQSEAAAMASQLAEAADEAEAQSIDVQAMQQPLTLTAEDALGRFCPQLFNDADQVEEDSDNNCATKDDGSVGADAAVAALMASLDRLSGTESIKVGEAGSERAGLATVSKPLCIQVSGRTLRRLLSILTAVAPIYFEKNDKSASYVPTMYTLIAALRVLKAHVYQLVRSQLPLSFFKIQTADAQKLKDFIVGFIERPGGACAGIEKDTNTLITGLVQAEAAQIFAEGFEFFFQAVSDQVTYLGDLLTKRLKCKSLSPAESTLLELLLARFASFASGALLLDELEGKGRQDARTDRRKSLAAVRDTLGLLLQVASDEAARDLHSLKSRDRSSPVVAILCNLQKHLLTRAGQWKLLSPEEEAKRRKLAKAKRRAADEPWRVAYETLEGYSVSLLQAALDVVLAASKRLAAATDAKTVACVAHGVLDQSIVGRLARPLVTSLSMFVGSDRILLAVRVLPLLAKFTSALDAFLSAAGRIPAAEAPRHLTIIRRVQSRHPYRVSGSVRIERIAICDATALRVELDPRCETPSQSDNLQLFAKEKGPPITPPMYGPSRQKAEANTAMADKPLATAAGAAGGGPTASATSTGGDAKVPPTDRPANAPLDAKSDGKGDSKAATPTPPPTSGQGECRWPQSVEVKGGEFWLKWTAKTDGGWGYALTIRAAVDRSPTAWLHGLAQAAADVCGSLAASLIADYPPEPAETRCKAWLASPLLRGGLSDVHPLVTQTADINDKKSLAQAIQSLHEFKKSGGQVAARAPADVKSLDSLWGSGDDAVFLQRLARGESGTTRCVLMLRKILRAKATVLPSVREAADRAVRLVFAVALYRVGAGRKAREFFDTLEQGGEAGDAASVPREVRAAFKVATQIQFHLQQIKAKHGNERLRRYENELIVKARFLLSLQPPTADTTPDPTKSDAKNANESESGAGPPGPPGLKRMASTWTRARELNDRLRSAVRTLRSLVLARTRSLDGGEAGQGKAMGALSRFLRADAASLQLPQLTVALAASRFRATTRLFGLRFAAGLVDALKTRGLATQVLRRLSLAFRRSSARDQSGSGGPGSDDTTTAKFHYLNRLDIAGTRLRAAVEDAYYCVIAAVMGQPQPDSPARVLLLDLCNIECSARDLGRLSQTGIVSLLRQSLVESLLGLVGRAPAALAIATRNSDVKALIARAAAAQADETKSLRTEETSLATSSDPVSTMSLKRRPWNARSQGWALTRLLLYLASQSAGTLGSDGDDTGASAMSVSAVAQLQTALFQMIFAQVETLAQLTWASAAADKSDEGKVSRPPASLTSSTQRALKSFWMQQGESGTRILSKGPNCDTGILYHLGCAGAGAAFTNPAVAGAVEVTISAITVSETPAHGAVDRKPFRYVTVATRSPTLKVDFKTHRINLSAFRLTFDAAVAEKPIFDWRLEGTIDRKSWFVVYKGDSKSAHGEGRALAQTYTVKKSVSAKGALVAVRLRGARRGEKCEMVVPRIEFFGVLDPAKRTEVKQARPKPSDWWRPPAKTSNFRAKGSHSSKTPTTIVWGFRSASSGNAARGAGQPRPFGQAGTAPVSFGGLGSGGSALLTPPASPQSPFASRSGMSAGMSAAMSAARAEDSIEECSDSDVELTDDASEFSDSSDNDSIVDNTMQPSPSPFASQATAASAQFAFGGGGRRGMFPGTSARGPPQASGNAVLGPNDARGNREYSGKFRVDFKLEFNKAQQYSLYLGICARDFKTPQPAGQARFGRRNGVLSGAGLRIFGQTSQLLFMGQQIRVGALPPIKSGDTLSLEFDPQGNGGAGSLNVSYGNGVRAAVPLRGLFKNQKIVIGASANGDMKLTMLTEPKKDARGSKSEEGKEATWARRSAEASLGTASNYWFTATHLDGGFSCVPSVRMAPPDKGELEVYLNQFLWVVLRCSRSPAVPQMLREPTRLRLLLRLCARGGSKMRQLLAIRTLRHVLPLAGPAGTGDADALIGNFLERIGFAELESRGLVPSNDKDDSAASNGEPRCHPDTETTVASELGSLLRALLRDVCWRDIINRHVAAAISALGGLERALVAIAVPNGEGSASNEGGRSAEEDAKSEPSQPLSSPALLSRLARALAAVAVLMGGLEPSREGARVVTESNGEVVSGTVMNISDGVKPPRGVTPPSMVGAAAGGPRSGGAGSFDVKSKKKNAQPEREFTIHFDNGDDITTRKMEKLDFVADVKLDLDDIWGSALDAAVINMANFVTSTAGLTVKKQSRNDALAANALILQLRARVLRSLHFILSDERFVGLLRGRGLGATLATLALKPCERIGDFDYATPYNLSGYEGALAGRFSSAERERAQAGYRWDFHNTQIDQGDTHGILYFLGTKRYSSPYTNPHDMGAVEVIASSLGKDSAPAAAVVGRESVRCVTQNKPGSFFTLDLKTVSCKPTHYTLRHYSSANQEALRTWELRGSADGKAWEKLKTHRSDAKLDKAGKCSTWPLSCDRFYRFFRVVQTGKNSNNTHYLALSGLELYGSLQEDGKPLRRPQRVRAAGDSAALADATGGAGGRSLAYHGDEIVCWAQYDNAGLCMARGQAVRTPKTLAKSHFGGERVVQVAMSNVEAFALTETGQVYRWGGGNQFGPFGGHAAQGNTVTTPQLIPELSEHKSIQIVSGYDSLGALSENGRVFVRSRGTCGELGDGVLRQGGPQPTRSVARVRGLGQRVLRIFSTNQGFLAVNDKNIVYAWGMAPATLKLLMGEGDRKVSPPGMGGGGMFGGGFGGGQSRFLSPKPLSRLSEHEDEWAHISLGQLAVLVLDVKGKLFTCGSMGGRGPVNPEFAPLDAFDGEKVVVAQACNYVYFVVNAEGALFSWGQNMQFACGIGRRQGQFYTPMRVQGFDGQGVVMVSGNGNRSLAATDAGHVYEWGYSVMGQQVPSPRRLSMLSSVTSSHFSQLVVGNSAYFALKTDRDMNVPALPIPYPYASAFGSKTTNAPWYPDMAFACGPVRHFSRKGALIDVVAAIDGRPEPARARGVTLRRHTGSASAKKDAARADERTHAYLFRTDSVFVDALLNEWGPCVGPVEGSPLSLLPTTVSASFGRACFRKAGAAAQPSDAKGKASDIKQQKLKMPLKMPPKMGQPPSKLLSPSPVSLSPVSPSPVSPSPPPSSPDAAALGFSDASKIQMDAPDGKTNSMTLCRIVDPGGEGRAWTVIELKVFGGNTVVLSLASAASQKGVVALRSDSTDMVPQRNSTADFRRVVVAVSQADCTVRAYVDAVCVAEVTAETKAELLNGSDAVAWRGLATRCAAGSARITFAEGVQGPFRDAALWKYESDAETLKRINSAGIDFVGLDAASTAAARDSVQVFHFDPRDGQTFAGKGAFVERGPGADGGARPDESKGAMCYKIDALSSMPMAVKFVSSADASKPDNQSSKEKLNEWSLLLDFMLPELPETSSSAILVAVDPALIMPVYRAAIHVDSVGRIRLGSSEKAVLPGKFRTSGTHRLALVRAGVWYRLSLRVRSAYTSSSTPHPNAFGGFGGAQRRRSASVEARLNGRKALAETKIDSKMGPLLALASARIGAPSNPVSLCIARAQIFPKKVRLSDLRGFERPEEPLVDPLGAADRTKSLLRMGFSAEWAKRALHETDGRRKAASDWIKANQENLRLQDLEAARKSAAQGLSLTGFPLNWCREALDACDGSLDKALPWILANHDRLVAKQATKTPAQLRVEAEDQRKAMQARLRMSTEKRSRGGSRGGHRMLSHTSEPMQIELSSVTRKDPPPRESAFPSLASLEKRQLRLRDQRLQSTASTVFSRRCVLAALANWPNGAAPDFKEFGGAEFVGRFLRLAEFSRLDGAMATMRAAVKKILEQERDAVNALPVQHSGGAGAENGRHQQLEGKAPTDDDTKTGTLSMSAFAKAAPLSLYLVSQALGDLLRMCNESGANVDGAKSEAEAVRGHWSAGLVVWTFDIFVELTKTKSPSSQPLTQYAQKVLLRQVVNLVFRAVAVLSGAYRLSFVQLLTTLVRMGVGYDPESCDVLKDLLNRLWRQQRRENQFSAFFQALLELVMVLDEASEAEASPSTPSSPTKDSAAIPLDGKAAAQSSDGGEGNTRYRSALCEYKSDGDENGVVYFVGSRRRGSNFWENPGETGHVTVVASSLDISSSDDFEILARGSGASPVVTDPEDPQPTITIDMHSVEVVPSHYTLRCGATKRAPRNWRLEASDDGKLWVPLRIHANDTALSKRGEAKTWPIQLNPTLRGPFSKFRIVGTGPSSGGVSELCLSGFEVYGQVREPKMQPLSWNLWEASLGLQLSADGGASWVKSVGGEPVKDAKLSEGADHGEGQEAPLPAPPTRVRTEEMKGCSQFARSTHGFSSGVHYFVFRVTKMPLERGSCKKNARIIVGIVTEAFSPAHLDSAGGAVAVLGAVGSASFGVAPGTQMGSWGFADSGFKLSSDRPEEFGPGFGAGDDVGVEIDLESGSVQLFVNDVPQGVAFTDLDGYQVYYPALALGVKGAEVELIGEMRRPPPKRPENWPWLKDVFASERVMKSFAGPQRALIPLTFAESVLDKSRQLGLGSAEREAPGGIDDKDLDAELKLPLADAARIRAALKPEFEAKNAELRKAAERGAENRTRVVSFLDPRDLEPGRAFFLQLTGLGSDALGAGGAVTIGLYSRGKNGFWSQVSTVQLLPPITDGVMWPKAKAPKQPGEFEFRIVGMGNQGGGFGGGLGMYQGGKSRPPGVQVKSPSFRAFTKGKQPAPNPNRPPPAICHVLYDASRFSLAADAQLVACVDRICDKRNVEATIKSFSPNKFNPGPHLIHYKAIEHKTTAELRVRLLQLMLLNRSVTALLPMLDFSVKPGMSRLADLVRGLRKLVFWSTKRKLWEAALADTQSAGGNALGEVNINRFKANRLRERGKCDERGTRTCFGQLFRRLNGADVTGFRASKGVRVWKTTFVGEGGIDAGGLYRELLHVVAQELQSPQLPLFILCPNGREQIGQNRDKWVPSPSATAPLHLAMYEFLGKLMGLSIRTLSLLNLDLPSIVWKALIGAPIEESDVVDIDRLSFKLIENMKTMEPRTMRFAPGPVGFALDAKCRVTAVAAGSQAEALGVSRGMRIVEIAGELVADRKALDAAMRARAGGRESYTVGFAGRISPKEFDFTFSATKFVIVGSDKKIHELEAGGAQRTLTWANRKEFCTKLVEYRKGEFKQQCEAMRRGLACVVPYPLLSIFAWEDLETQVCGRAQMNVDLLQKMTRYRGCSASDRHIQFFWQIMRERFDEMERAKFLKFVWGRARLPVRAADFQTHFTINQLGTSGSPDNYMPIGHTCFFSVDIPRYTSLAVMHKKLLYAITHCEAIDADYGPESIQAAADESSSDEEDDV